MADCIFNGPTKRPPLGMAEVTITMEDPELAEAARFVLESAQLESAGEAPSSPTSENDATVITDPNIQILSLDPAPTPESQQDATGPQDPASQADEAAASVPEFLKGKRRKKSGDKPVLATKPGEVVVTRRLYRSGQSEYLINGRIARLRDIQEMFMGVGLGPDSYAIIEQGRIGLILSTKPMERRAIIEEAAGVTKFKTKKRLAEAKLESSKLNLARVNDIVVEVEKQLGSLRRQASKARRYAEIRDQMRGIVRQMLAGKARELDAEAERIGKQLAELTAAETQHAQTIQQQEGEQDRLNQRIYGLDAEIRQNQNVLNLTALEVDRTENRISFNQQRASELGSRHTQVSAEMAEAAAQVAEWESRSSTQQLSVNSLREESGARSASVEEFAARAESRATQIQQSEARIESLRHTASEAGESLLRLHGEQKQAEEALVHHLEALRKREASEHELLETSIRIRDEADQAAHDWEAASGQLTELTKNAAGMQARISELRQQREITTQKADALRDSLSGVRARHATLTQILNDRSYTADAVQKLFAANERGGGQSFRAVGVLADYAEVEEQHEAAIEQYLRDELEYVVVETYDHARAGVSLLRDEVGGRATFFVDSLRHLRLPEYEPIINFHLEDGVISRLDKLVGFRDPLGAAAKQFLPRLRSAYLTDSAVSAEKLARDNPQFAFVAPDGTCYQGRMVTGGRADEAGPLGMKRELRTLDADILSLEQQMNDAQAELAQVTAELRETEASLEQITAKQRDAERSVFSNAPSRAHAKRTGAPWPRADRLSERASRLRKGSLKTQDCVPSARKSTRCRRRQSRRGRRRSSRLLKTWRSRGLIHTEQNELATARAELAAPQ
jgi:chromosome segregation protein